MQPPQDAVPPEGPALQLIHGSWKTLAAAKVRRPKWRRKLNPTRAVMQQPQQKHSSQYYQTSAIFKSILNSHLNRATEYTSLQSIIDAAGYRAVQRMPIDQMDLAFRRFRV